MKKNIILISILFMVSFLFIITCAGNTTEIDEEDEFLSATEFSNMEENLENYGIPAQYIAFDYPIPEGMIEDDTAKQAMIDAKIEHLKQMNKLYWGSIPDNSNELEFVFEDVWYFISSEFPGFKGLDLDWEKFRDDYMEKIGKSANYGEYAHIMTLMAYSLKEGHSQVVPGRLVSKVEDGVIIPGPMSNAYLNKAPIFIPSNTCFIAACYTVSYDEELIISKIWDDSPNPYNFKLGDEILGFNGVKWIDWIPALEKSGLPFLGSPAASESSIRYNLLRAAMANVGLFEKMNIRRYETGEIETVDVIYIENPTGDAGYTARAITCTELTETDGLVDPDDPEKTLSWKDDPVLVSGIIKDKNIGYIYLKSCPSGFNDGAGEWNPYETDFSKKFDDAVLKLMDTEGIIIDLRYNTGGRPEPLYKGLSHLIKEEEDQSIFKTAIIDKRNDPVDRVNLVDIEDITGDPLDYPLKVDEPNQCYENPIIVMTGPDCISACDMLIAVLSRFPEFTIIGRDTNGSSAGVHAEERWLDNEQDYVSQYIPSQTFYFTDDPHNYLVRRTGFIQEEVWFQKDDIVNGVDSIRKRAIEMISEMKNSE